MIRVLVVDKVHLMCEVISAALEDENDIRVVGITTCVEEALVQVNELRCNLILINTSLGEAESLRLIDCIKQGNPDVKILVIGMADSEAVILSFIEAGASGYTLLEDSLDELLKNIRAIIEDKALIAPEIAAALIERITSLSAKLSDINIDPNVYEELTPREKEILSLIADGYSNREIANTLTVELGTVKNHVHNILNKLSVSSRKDAAAYLSLIEDLKSTDSIC